MSLFKNISKIRGIRSEIRTLFRAYTDKRTPPRTRFIIAALGFLYIISPIDIAPDILPLIGLTDDILIVSLLMWLFLPQKILTDARKKSETNEEKKQKKLRWILWGIFFICLLLGLFFLYRSLGFDLRNEAPIMPNNL